MLVLAQEVERTIPADGEEPGLEIVTDLGDVLLAEPKEGVLHHITGIIVVAQNPPRIRDQRSFEACDAGLNPGCVSGHVGCFHERHARAGRFLGTISPGPAAVEQGSE